MRLRRPVIAGVVLAVLALLPPTAANASTGASSPTPTTTRVTTPMTVGGYNAQVAAAHGYKIVTHSDGTQESVPVTAAAVAERKQADQARIAAQAKSQSTVTPAVVGNCGSSWLQGTKIANDTVTFQTGFIVYLAAYEHTWTVNAVGFITANHWTTTGAGPANGSDSWQGAIYNVVGPGYAGVPAWSASASVVLRDGTVCYSLGPTFNFG